MAKDTKNIENMENIENAGKTTETVQSDKQKHKFPLERLRRDCLKILGVTTSTFDGAAKGLEGEFTVDEMKTKIEEWLNKPVKFKKGAE